MKIDIDRCRAGMKHLNISGRPRADLIEVAIGLIQTKPRTALTGEFLGIKNYASFGDQRSDCRYGMCPRHGSIVFRIERTQAGRKPVEEAGRAADPLYVALGDDEIYLLECARDFGIIDRPKPEPGRHPTTRELNLLDVLRELLAHELETVILKDAIEAIEVESALLQAGG